MRRSSIVMLAVAILLGLFAAFLARSLLGRSQKVADATVAVPTVQVVVAAAPIAFGEKITNEKLKLVQWPTASLPDGTYRRIGEAVDNGQRVALRAIEPNEVLIARAISGEGGRLSTSPLLGETMRAVAFPVNEVAGTGGFLVPGDRVDVFMSRSGDNDELPYTDLLVQGARVLAVGQNADAGAAQPTVTKSVTVEVTPVQAQKIALAQTVGVLSVALRSLTDESRVRLATAQIFDLNDGVPTRILRKANRNLDADAPGASPRAPSGPVIPAGPSVEIFRGGKNGTTSAIYGVPRG